MKILLVNKFHYRRGGSETYYFNIAKALRERGHEVIFFSMEDPHNEPCEQAKYFVRAKDYNQGGLLAKAREVATITYSKEARDKFEALLQAEQPDIVHLNLVHRQITLSILDAPSIKGIPVLFTAHDQILVCPNYSLFDGEGHLCEDCLDKSRNYQPCIDKRCVKGSRAKSMLAAHEARWIASHHMYDKIDAFISPSQYTKEKMIQAGFDAERVHVMYNFVEGLSEIEGEVRIANNSQIEPYFLYFGRLLDEKALDVLLDAFELFCAQMSENGGNCNWKLKLAGDGPMREALEKQAKGLLHASERIEFLGFLTGKPLEDAIEGCSASVLCSMVPENMPFSVIESYMHKRPVIGTCLGGLPEIVQEGKTGFLCEPSNVESLADAMMRAANCFTFDVKAYEKMGEQGRAFAVKECNIDTYMNKLIELYEQLASKKINPQA